MNYPILLTEDGRYDVVLNKAFNIVVEDQLLTTSDGYETLTFCMRNDDKRRWILSNEKEVEVDGRRYIVRVIEDDKGSSNICTVSCDAVWYDLNDGELKHLMHSEESMIDAKESIRQQLSQTGWTIGTVDVPGRRDRHTSDAVDTSLYNLRQISDLFGGDLSFDTVNKRVSLLSSLGVRHQKIFTYEKNTTNIKRLVDTRNLFTRFSLIGSDADGNDVTVASINDGKDYLENFSWYDSMGLPRKIKWYKKTDQRWSDKYNMLDHMKSWLEVYSKPSVSYELAISLFDLSPELGDYVYVHDTDLAISGWLRVVSRKKNLSQPHLSTVQLESTRKTIVESIVTSKATTQVVENIVSGVMTPSYDVKLPAGTEGWVMQYLSGAWRASNVIGDINSVLDRINGEVL